MSRSKTWDIVSILLGCVVVAMFARVYLLYDKHWGILVAIAASLASMALNFISLLRRS